MNFRVPKGALFMVDLDFALDSVTVEPYSATPLLLFKLRVTNLTPALKVQNVMLNCQIRIDAARRAYDATEKEQLLELFGEPRRWGETLRSFLWTNASICTPRFDDECSVDLPVPCSFDFNIAATKFFHGIEKGEAPLSLLFSGSVFYRDAEGDLQIEQIPWSKEASYRLPASVWRGLMEQYYPQSAWLRLSREAFDQLYRFKRQNGLATWEQALQVLLDSKGAANAETDIASTSRPAP